MDEGAWWATVHKDHKESDTTEHAYVGVYLFMLMWLLALSLKQKENKIDYDYKTMEGTQGKILTWLPK